MPLPPLRFTPLAIGKVWGGRRLARFGRDLPPDSRIGESWEVSDFEDAVTCVAGGPLSGMSLRALMEDRASELVGNEGSDPFGRYPLLLKLLDASERLSLQVHPDDKTAAMLGDRRGGKEEAWLVLESTPEGVLALGLKPEVDTATLFDALEGSGPDHLVNWVKVEAGDIIHIPPGLVHAVGAGVVVMEIQQTSDATYRLWDWARQGSRPLHLGEGRAAARPSLVAQVMRLDGSTQGPLPIGDKLELSIVRLDGTRVLSTLSPTVLFVFRGTLTADNGEGAVDVPEFGHAVLPVDPSGATITGRADVLVMRSRK